MPVELTEKKLRNTNPAEAGKRYVLWDAIVPGLGARVTVARPHLHPDAAYRRREDAAAHDAGRYPALGLAEARKRARALLETLVDMGIDDADVARLMADFEAELVAWRTATMAKIGRCIEEPDAPSHELQ